MAQGEAGGSQTVPPAADGGDDANGEVEGDDEEEDEDAARSYFYHVPAEAKKRIQQVQSETIPSPFENQLLPHAPW